MVFNTFVVLLILFNFIFIYMFFIEPHAVQVEHDTVALKEKHREYAGLKIVHLSDLHIDQFGSYEEKVIRLTNGQEPDYIFVTGDLIGYGQHFSHAIRFLNRLRAKNGIYVVFGNSDYSHMHTYFAAIKETPLKSDIVILRNDVVKETWHNKPICIAGLDDPISQYAQINKMPLFHEIDELSILLTHAYTKTVQNRAPGVDLVLAGHTHGGQINLIPKRLIKKWRNKTDKTTHLFIDGLQKDGTSWVHISRGIGVSYIPVRFRARPEIAVIEFA